MRAWDTDLESRAFPTQAWVLCRGNLGAAVDSSKFPPEVSGLWGCLAYPDISSSTDSWHSFRHFIWLFVLMSLFNKISLLFTWQSTYCTFSIYLHYWVKPHEALGFLKLAYAHLFSCKQNGQQLWKTLWLYQICKLVSSECLGMFFHTVLFLSASYLDGVCLV